MKQMTKLTKSGEMLEFLPKELKEKAKKIISGDLPGHQALAVLARKFTMTSANNTNVMILAAAE